MSADAPAARVVALGASNLVRGLPTVVAAARRTWGRDVEVLAALGHGRSYGAPSRVLVRTLPGILDCDLWSALAARPPAPTRALVADIGNDILYGCSARQVLAWVDETIARLRRITRDVVVVDLPMDNVRRLSAAKFLFFRTLFFPGRRPSLGDVREAAADVSAGLARLAGEHGVRLLVPRPEWYGVDPIHIRPSSWRAAWQEILGCTPTDLADRRSRIEAARLYLAAPERRWICGIEQRSPQRGTRLRDGARIWLY